VCRLNANDYSGKWVVLFFYPKDFTFVCPTEIIAFSDRVEEFRSRNAEVIGASCDSAEVCCSPVALGNRVSSDLADMLPLLLRPFPAIRLPRLLTQVACMCVLEFFDPRGPPWAERGSACNGRDAVLDQPGSACLERTTICRQARQGLSGPQSRVTELGTHIGHGCCVRL
jgi:hypothetical protein